MTAKFVRLSAVLLLLASVGFALGLYLPSAQQVLKSWERALGGDQHLHLLAGCFIPLSLALLGRLYVYSYPAQALAWLGCLTLFALDEYVQRFSAFRSSNLQDFMYSMVGWSIGLVLYGVWLRFFRNR